MATLQGCVAVLWTLLCPCGFSDYVYYQSAQSVCALLYSVKTQCGRLVAGCGTGSRCTVDTVTFASAGAAKDGVRVLLDYLCVSQDECAYGRSKIFIANPQTVSPAFMSLYKVRFT